MDLPYERARKRARTSVYKNLVSNTGGWVPNTRVSSAMVPYVPQPIVPYVPVRRTSSLYHGGIWRKSGNYGRYQGGGTRSLKYLDTSISGTISTTAAIPTGGQLCLIPQNSTASGRIGTHVVVKRISIKGVLQWQPAQATNASGVTWVYLILDKQCNGAAAGATDVFDTASLVSSFLNIENSQRFVILKCFKHVWNHDILVTTGTDKPMEQDRYINWSKSFRYPMCIDNTDGAITGIRNNNVFVLAGATGGSTMDNKVTIQLKARVRYEDPAN